MSTRPRFSILLPTHNRADVLPFAIQSVFSQTEQDFELLVVLDGCTDGTAALLAELADERVRWFDLPKGPGFGYANRNVALRQARGAYIAFMAHDDLWFPDHLRLLADAIEARDVELAYSTPLWVIPRGLVAPVTYNLNDRTTCEGFLLHGQNGIPASCVVHRRECLDKYGYWDETLAGSADRDMWARIISARNEPANFVHLDTPTTLHFRAAWRTEDTTERRLRIWKRLHDIPGAMPEALKIPVSPGESEQAAVWRAISAAPDAWMRGLREAVIATIDRRVALSDELMLHMLPLDEGHDSSAVFASALADPSQLVATLEHHGVLTGLRAFRALRQWKRRIAPSGTLRGRAWGLLRGVRA